MFCARRPAEITIGMSQRCPQIWNRMLWIWWEWQQFECRLASIISLAVLASRRKNFPLHTMWCSSFDESEVISCNDFFDLMPSFWHDMRPGVADVNHIHAVHLKGPRPGKHNLVGKTQLLSIWSRFQLLWKMWNLKSRPSNVEIVSTTFTYICRYAVFTSPLDDLDEMPPDFITIRGEVELVLKKIALVLWRTSWQSP